MSAEEKHKIAEIGQYLDELAERIVKEMHDALGGEINYAALCTLIEYILKHAVANYGDAVAILEVVKFKMLSDMREAAKILQALTS